MTSESNQNDGGPAFPTMPDRREIVGEMNGTTLTRQVAGQVPGMTMRDWFAGQAIMGWLASAPENQPQSAEAVSKYAFEVADAMLAARKADGKAPESP